MKEFLPLNFVDRPRYVDRTPEFYLQDMEPDILESFSPAQRQAIANVLDAAIPKPAPKIVDLRFGVDLLLARYYIVLFVGKDRRRQRRQYLPNRVSWLGNMIAATIILLSVNLLISLFIFLTAYLVKSAIGIDLFPHEHLLDQVKKFGIAK